MFRPNDVLIVDVEFTNKSCFTLMAVKKSFIYSRIVISIYLQRPQKRGRGNQLIHRCLSRTKSIGSGLNSESQAGRQTVRRLLWMVFGVETWREVGGKRTNQDRIC